MEARENEEAARKASELRMFLPDVGWQVVPVARVTPGMNVADVDEGEPALFDPDQCERGMIISDDRTTVTKNGGSGLVLIFGLGPHEGDAPASYVQATFLVTFGLGSILTMCR